MTRLWLLLDRIALLIAYSYWTRCWKFRIVRHECGARDAASPVALVKSSRGGTQTAES